MLKVLDKFLWLIIQSGVSSDFKNFTVLLPEALSNVDRFSFRMAVGNKFVVKSPLRVPPHLKHVATLPCEIFGTLPPCSFPA